MAEDGYDLTGPALDPRSLDEVEADERARVRALREAFNQVSAGVLTEKQRKVILAHTSCSRRRSAPSWSGCASNDRRPPPLGATMTELLLTAAFAPLNIVGGIAVARRAKDWPSERRGLKQRMLSPIPEEFGDRVLREHPQWRDGIVPMSRVKLVLRLYAMS